MMKRHFFTCGQKNNAELQIEHFNYLFIRFNFFHRSEVWQKKKAPKIIYGFRLNATHIIVE